MKKTVFLGAVAMTLLAASCSQESDQPTRNDAITFGVTTNLASRAANAYCNTNLPEDFKFSAFFADGAAYIDGATATKGDGSAYTATGYFWPENALNFVAWKNGNMTINEAGERQFVSFSPAANATEMLDLLYAVKNGVSRTQVRLNFRHALSQIVFKAQNNATDVFDIEVSQVKVGHLTTTGTYTFPTVDTDNQNYDKHEGTGTIVEGTTGNWQLEAATAGLGEYTSTGFTTVKLGSEPSFITPVEHTGGIDYTMMLLPQTAAKWDPTVTGATYNGAYFMLYVTIKDVQHGGKLIYDGWTVVPADINWEQGSRYTYTFIFDNNGHGGYTPTPNDPKPILAGIKMNLTVDDYIDGDNTNTPMGN